MISHLSPWPLCKVRLSFSKLKQWLWGGGDLDMNRRLWRLSCPNNLQAAELEFSTEAVPQATPVCAIRTLAWYHVPTLVNTNISLICMFEQVSWGVNASDLRSEGAQFESRSGHRLSREVFQSFNQSLQVNNGLVPWNKPLPLPSTSSLVQTSLIVLLVEAM
jgi:hypothetical protein